MLKDGRRTHALKNDDLPRPTPLIGALTAAICMMGVTASQAAPAEPAPNAKPNILVIWGDDIGGFNINAYNQGVMGGRAGRIHHRPIADPNRIDQGRPSPRNSWRNTGRVACKAPSRSD